MTDPFERITKSKQRERRRLAALPFAEKLRLLEELRDREAAIIADREHSSDAALPDRVLLLREPRVRYDAGGGRNDRNSTRI